MPSWLDELIKEVLPTTWMRLIAAITATSTLGALFLHEGLKSIGLQFEYLARPEIRILLALLALCIGLILLFALALVHIKKIKSLHTSGNKKIATKEIQTPVLEETTVMIFTFVGNFPDKSTNTIASELKLNEEFALHQLEQLEKFKLVDGSYGASDRYWRATSRGRELMAEKKLFLNKPAKHKDWRI